MLFGTRSVTPWSIRNPVLETTFDISGQTGAANAVRFKDDGTKMYISTAGGTVLQYTLSTPWEIATASYDSVSLDTSSQDSAPTNIFFHPLGTALVIQGDTNDTVYKYSLSTAWDLSTASYASDSFDYSAQTSEAGGVEFNSTRLKMYIGGQNTIYQYTLSSALALGTASYDSVSLSVSGQEVFLESIFFKPDRTRLFTIGASDDANRYDLSTAADLSTASHQPPSADLSSYDGTHRGIAFKTDGTKMYTTGIDNDKVYQFSL